MNNEHFKHDKLILKFRPWFIWIVGGFSNLIWIFACFSIFLDISQTKTLSCQRLQSKQINCLLITSNLLNSNPKTIPIQDLQGARVDVIDNIKNSQTIQEKQLMLLTKEEEIPLRVISRTNKPQISDIIETEYVPFHVQQINDFVNKSQEPTLVLRTEESQNIKVIILLVVLINFIWFLFMSEVVTCDFDKIRGSVIKKRQWFWLISRTVEYPLKDIIDVIVEERYNRGSKQYRVKLLLNSNKDLPLTSYSTNFLKSQHTTNNVANSIIEFLKGEKTYTKD